MSKRTIVSSDTHANPHPQDQPHPHPFHHWFAIQAFIITAAWSFLAAWIAWGATP